MKNSIKIQIEQVLNQTDKAIHETEQIINKFGFKSESISDLVDQEFLEIESLIR